MSEGRGEGLRNIVAANVRHLRRAKQLSQEDLGAASNLHRTYVGSVERSERNLSIDSIAALADGLGVEAWVLLRPQSDAVTVES
ncbi:MULTISPECIES: helix-turn-helix domain-containing protein [Brevundimonas]|uniref:helix-turn-helix domain-containing protein n=1 Tax=Brevundimonas TaxID=41275 RepID=UPI0019068862|nr:MULTISPECIES: helix-turn-helix transcriptional regulator [Brevundimonas]MBK1975402.1 helix-turn-helix transcriptional regulator [Brevundimonas diminuta]MDM8354099.1 helix-turn-helix transcriptional regulator [Brevundimonas diminuta]